MEFWLMMLVLTPTSVRLNTLGGPTYCMEYTAESVQTTISWRFCRTAITMEPCDMWIEPA